MRGIVKAIDLAAHYQLRGVPRIPLSWKSARAPSCGIPDRPKHIACPASLSSMVLGIALPAGDSGLRDEREQHVREFIAAGLVSAGATRANREPVHARHAWRSFARKPVDWVICEPDRCERCVVGQRTPRGCGASRGGSPLGCLVDVMTPLLMTTVAHPLSPPVSPPSICSQFRPSC